MCEPIVSNIKFRFRIDPSKNIRCKLKNIEEYCNVSWRGNIAILRETYGVFIIFFASGHVNVTKIRRLGCVVPAVKKLLMLLSLTCKNVCSRIIVDNITSSGTFGKTINLNSLERKLERERPHIYVRLNANYFPGGTCRLPGLGTIIVFSTGSYIIHSRCRSRMMNIYHQSSVFISTK